MTKRLRHHCLSRFVIHEDCMTVLRNNNCGIEFCHNFGESIIDNA